MIDTELKAPTQASGAEVEAAIDQDFFKAPSEVYAQLDAMRTLGEGPGVVIELKGDTVSVQRLRDGKRVGAPRLLSMTTDPLGAVFFCAITWAWKEPAAVDRSETPA